MNTLGQSESDIQSYAQRERKRKCTGGSRPHRTLCPTGTKALFSESHVVGQHGLTEGPGKSGEDEFPQLWCSQTTPPLQVGSPLNRMTLR